MARKVSIFKKIEGLDDIGSILFSVQDSVADCPVTDAIRKILSAEEKIVHIDESLEEHLHLFEPDILFFRFDGSYDFNKIIRLSKETRDSGFEGIFILITDPITSRYQIDALLSSDGFDSYIFTSDGFERVQDALSRAILGRKRKVKYNICFDDSLDAFYTIDENGAVYDINEAGTNESDYIPREVVRDKVSIYKVGTLRPFRGKIKPLIKESNIDRVFKETYEEKNYIYQLKTKIQNAPTIGLVSTVVKTNVTKLIYTNTLDLLVNSITLLSQRDNYTAGHSARVFYYALYFMYATGYTSSRKFSRALYMAALLHDIGKIGIRDDVLLKNSKLNDDESSAISQHPQKGYKMLKRYEFLADSIEIILSHHERADGKGYPNKLKGNKIPYGASVLSIFDGFDAMTTDRPYRKALPFEVAFNEIKKNIGSQYNPDVAGEFLAMITPALVTDVHELAKKPLETIANELVETILKE